jgi:hypothetical protein
VLATRERHQLCVPPPVQVHRRLYRRNLQRQLRREGLRHLLSVAERRLYVSKSSVSAAPEATAKARDHASPVAAGGVARPAIEATVPGALCRELWLETCGR